MQISIYSLKKILFQGEAKSLTCPTLSGEITILDHHHPLISVLKKGVIHVIDKNEKIHYINASSGFLEVQNNIARLILEPQTE